MSYSAHSTIAVIGGGASAVLFLAHLGATPNNGVYDITVYEPSGEIGLGVAYSTRDLAHLLNVRARNMSAFHHEPDHFVKWLAAGSFCAYGADDFVPRKIYGEYLQDVLQQSIAALRGAGHEIRIVREKTYKPEADFVLLANGNSRKPGFDNFVDPWRVDYAALSGLKHVLIAGTGLSMIDAVVSLHNAGFSGQVTALSRRGLVPAPHVDPVSYPPFLSVENMPRTAYGLLRLVRQHVVKARAQNIPWQSVIDALRPVTNPVWQALPEAEQRKFIRRLMPFWTVHRHRVSAAPVNVVREWLDSGRLRIVKDHILDARENESGIRITGRHGAYDADVVLNCLGYVPETSEYRYDAALGMALWPEYIECTAIPEIRAMASVLVQRFAL